MDLTDCSRTSWTLVKTVAHEYCYFKLPMHDFQPLEPRRAQKLCGKGMFRCDACGEVGWPSALTRGSDSLTALLRPDTAFNLQNSTARNIFMFHEPVMALHDRTEQEISKAAGLSSELEMGRTRGLPIDE